MASELLRTLEKIEDGRKNIINNLNSKGYDLPEDSSLYNIGNKLITIPNNEPSYTLVNGIKYYDNPEDDPEVWARPNDWPDYKGIFKTFDDIEIETLKSNGSLITMTLCPTVFGILDNENDTITFKDGYGDPIDNSMDIGYIRGPNYVDQHKCICRVITSDNVTYDLDVYNKSATHTWDKSKDINGKYRWFVLYLVPRSGWSMDSNFGPNNTDIIELTLAASSYGSGLMGSSKNQKLLSLNIIDPFTKEGLLQVDNSYGSASLYLENSTYTKFSNIKRLSYETKLVTHLKIEYSYVPVSLNSLTILNNDNGVTYLIPKLMNLRYALLGKFNGYFGGAYNSGSNSEYIQGWGNNIKYLEVDEEIFPNYIKTTNFRGLCGYSKLQNPNKIIKYVVKSGSGDQTSNNADYTQAAVQCKEWNFENLKEINGRYFMFGVNTEVINLPELEIIPSSTTCFAYTTCKYLYMPKLKRIESTGFNLPTGLLELELPELEYVAKGLISQTGYTTYTISTLTYLSLPKIKECSEHLLNRLYSLRTLHMPKGFKQSLQLCGLKSLSVESMMELCENLADVTEEDQVYTLKVLKSTYDIYKDCYAIAEAKGWVITQLS